MTSIPDSESGFERDLTAILRSLSEYFRKNDNDLLSRLLAQANCIVSEYKYDNWNGGLYEYDLYITVPNDIYVDVVGDIDSAKSTLRDKISSAYGFREGDRIGELSIRPDPLNTSNQFAAVLNEEGQTLMSPKIPNSDHLWPSDVLRVFISHSSVDKKIATGLKDYLFKYGVHSFVAHEMIKPTKDWQNEIECALLSMDCLVALISEKFKVSDWTGQEVGAAIGRQLFVVAVRMGANPYGFIGKYQAVSLRGNESEMQLSVLDRLFENEKTSKKAIDSLIWKMKNSSSYNESRRLFKEMARIDHLTSKQVTNICQAFNENSQIRDCINYSGDKGLPYHLKRITGESYEILENPKRIKKYSKNF